MLTWEATKIVRAESWFHPNPIPPSSSLLTWLNYSSYSDRCLDPTAVPVLKRPVLGFGVREIRTGLAVIGSGSGSRTRQYWFPDRLNRINDTFFLLKKFKFLSGVVSHHFNLTHERSGILNWNRQLWFYKIETRIGPVGARLQFSSKVGQTGFGSSSGFDFPNPVLISTGNSSRTVINAELLVLNWERRKCWVEK